MPVNTEQRVVIRKIKLVPSPPHHQALPVTESVVLPPVRGKHHVSTTIFARFHVHSATSLPELPIGNDALPYFADARGTRLTHV